jgi:hypothetical protein
MYVNDSILELDRSIDSLKKQNYSQWELLLIYGSLNQDEINQLNSWPQADKRIHLHAWSPEINESPLQYGMSLARGTLILPNPLLGVLKPNALEQGLAFMEENSNCLLTLSENVTNAFADEGSILSSWQPCTPFLMRRSLMLLLKISKSIDKDNSKATFPSQMDWNLEHFQFQLLVNAQFKDRCSVWHEEIVDANVWSELTTLEQKNRWLYEVILRMKGINSGTDAISLPWLIGHFMSLNDHDLANSEAFANELCDSLKPTQGDELRSQLQGLFQKRLWINHSNMFAPAWQDQSFSMAISLGNFCHTANTIRDLHLRAFSGPFDWIFSSPEAAAHMIGDRFQTFLDPQYFRYTPLEDRQWPNENLCDHEFYRQHYGIRFMFNHHDVTKAEDHAFFQRCVERTMHALQAQRPPLFILVTHDVFDLNRFRPIQEALSLYSPNFGLLIVRFLSDNIQHPQQLIQAKPTTLFHEEGILALELRTSSRSNGLHFSDSKDEDAFKRLLQSFKVQEHLVKLEEGQEKKLPSICSEKIAP